MKEIVQWLKDALSSKKLVTEMTYYRVAGGEVKATDGRLTACHPYDGKHEFLVPGAEFEKALAKMGDKVLFVEDEDNITLKSGRSRVTISTLPIENWDYPGIDSDQWMPFPAGLLPSLKKLIPFVSDNAVHAWALGITLENEWCYATNNVALAGIHVPSIGDVQAILPIWAVEFILDRSQGLKDWCWTENYVAFQWENGAWMRSSLIDGKFPEQASSMVRKAAEESPDLEVTDEFKEAFFRVADVATGSITITSTEMSSGFGRATLTEEFDLEEVGETPTYWSAKFLKPVMQIAEAWEPGRWPRPCPFYGGGLVGYVMGQRTPT